MSGNLFEPKGSYPNRGSDPEKPKSSEGLKIEYNIMGSMTIQLNNTFNDFHLTQFPYPDIGALKAILQGKPPTPGQTPPPPPDRDSKTPDPGRSTPNPQPPGGFGPLPDLSRPSGPPSIRTMSRGPGSHRSVASLVEEKESPLSDRSESPIRSIFEGMSVDQVYAIMGPHVREAIANPGKQIRPEGLAPLPIFSPGPPDAPERAASK
jgi:hypothetical protein